MDGESALATYEDFARIQIRVGRVVRAELSPKARNPAYRLSIDFGPLGIKASSARVTMRYRPEELVGRLVVAVTNLPPRQVADVRSEVLVLGAVVDDETVVLLRPDTDVPPGLRIL